MVLTSVAGQMVPLHRVGGQGQTWADLLAVSACLSWLCAGLVADGLVREQRCPLAPLKVERVRLRLWCI